MMEPAEVFLGERASSMVTGAGSILAGAVSKQQGLASAVDSSSQPADEHCDVQNSPPDAENLYSSALDAEQAEVMPGSCSKDGVLYSTRAIDIGSGDTLKDATAAISVKDSSEFTSMMLFSATDAAPPSVPESLPAAAVQETAFITEPEPSTATVTLANSSHPNGSVADAVQHNTSTEADTATLDVNGRRTATDPRHTSASPFTAAAAIEEQPLDAEQQVQQADATPSTSNLACTQWQSSNPAVQQAATAIYSHAAGPADISSAQATEPLTIDLPQGTITTTTSSSSSLSITVPALVRAGSNAIGQIKSPSRLRRMSLPATAPDQQQEQQSMLAQLDYPDQASSRARAQSQPGTTAPWNDEQQQQQQDQSGGHSRSQSDSAAPEALEFGAQIVYTFAGGHREQLQQQRHQTHNSDIIPGMQGNFAEPIPNDISSSSSHLGGPHSPAHRMEAPSAVNHSSSSSSSSYSAALAATQQFPWPLSWHWPDKMLHAAAIGVRPINVHSSSSSGAGSSGGPSAGSSGGRSEGRSSRPGSPSSPSRSRSRSPGRAAAATITGQQQQFRPPELLSALHAYIASAPPIKQAFAAATAAVMQQQVGNHSDHSTGGVEALDNSTAVPDAVVGWHRSLQQQFAAAFCEWDSDDDGYLNPEELQRMLQEVLPVGTVGKEEARYCQVMLDRSGSGLISPQDLLSAAHTAVTQGVGVVPKTKVDINDVLLHLVVQLKQQQQQQQQGGPQGFAAQVRNLFLELDASGSSRLGRADLAKMFRRILPGISHQDIRYILTHMCDVTPDSSQVSLKQLVAAVQPVHQALQQISSTLQHQGLQQQLHLPHGTDQQNIGQDSADQRRQQQQQWDLPKPPSPVRLSPRPGNPGSSSSSNNNRNEGVRSPGVADDSSSSGGEGVAAVLVCESDEPVPPVLWPMQELAALLSSHPTVLQLAFMQTAAAAAAAAAKFSQHASQQQRCSRASSTGGCSSSPMAMQQQLGHHQQQRYSLIPISSLPQLLAAAAPGWGGADVSYAALQIRCHMNVVANFAIDTPTAAAAGSSTAHPAAVAADPPSDLMYAELAATIISAAGTESAAAAGQLPAAVEQLVVDLADDLMSDESSRSKLAAAWDVAAAAAVGCTAISSSSSSTDHNHGRGLPVVAAVKLLCKQLVGLQGLSDIRLLAWLTCLVRQQHLAMQLAATHTGSSSSGGGSSGSDPVVASAADADQVLGAPHGVLSAEICLDQFCEVLLQIVQGLLPAEDASLIEDFKHQQQQQHIDHWDSSSVALHGQMEGEQTGVDKSNRRARIQFDGSTPTPSDCSPAWCPAEHHQQKSDEGLRSLDTILASSAGYFQPSSVRISAHRGPYRDRSTPGCNTGSHFASFLLDDHASTRFSNHSGRFSSNGGVLPVDVQQQREQLDRLRAAQQQAWKAEMLMQHMPWEGAYSPVAAVAAAAAQGGYFGSAKVVDLLRISSSDFRTSSNVSEGY